MYQIFYPSYLPLLREVILYLCTALHRKTRRRKNSLQYEMETVSGKRKEIVATDVDGTTSEEGGRGGGGDAGQALERWAGMRRVSF